MVDSILEVLDLQVEFATYGGIIHAVRGVNFAVRGGETLAIVGESGCGKSVTVQSIMGLIPMPPGKITAGSVQLNGKHLLGLSTKQANRFRGAEIGMIFQDPMTSLNPTMTIGEQISETLMVHRHIPRREAKQQAIALLEKTHIPEASKRAKQYPFEFSGGMLQRAMIAQSLVCHPAVLIADEPTTALDVTIQAQILELMMELQRTHNMAIILITHDLAVVAKMADRVAVMYAGQILETGTVDDVFYRSAHPYTLGLKDAMPSNRRDQHKRLSPIPGSPPDLFAPPVGCSYFARCAHAMKVCENHPPNPSQMNRDTGHTSCCWLQHTQAPSIKELEQVGKTDAG